MCILCALWDVTNWSSASTVCRTLAHGDRYTQVLCISQPISGRAKLFVTNNTSDPAVFEKCNPIVNVWCVTFVWRASAAHASSSVCMCSTRKKVLARGCGIERLRAAT
jgi:hypothetical protein